MGLSALARLGAGRIWVAASLEVPLRGAAHRNGGRRLGRGPNRKWGRAMARRRARDGSAPELRCVVGAKCARSCFRPCVGGCAFARPRFTLRGGGGGGCGRACLTEKVATSAF